MLCGSQRVPGPQVRLPQASSGLLTTQPLSGSTQLPGLSSLTLHTVGGAQGLASGSRQSSTHWSPRQTWPGAEQVCLLQVLPMPPLPPASLLPPLPPAPTEPVWVVPLVACLPPLPPVPAGVVVTCSPQASSRMSEPPASRCMTLR